MGELEPPTRPQKVSGDTLRWVRHEGVGNDRGVMWPGLR
jgi:hypothetical protein